MVWQLIAHEAQKKQKQAKKKKKKSAPRQRATVRIPAQVGMAGSAFRRKRRR